jgi:hypothetical protein
MQLYDITITASQTRQLDARGNYFYYYAGSAGGADPTITLRGLSSGLRIVLKPGQAFRLPAGSSENSWVMTNYAGAATILGSVIVGNGEITDNRVTGSVEVVDGGKNRTNAGTAFSSAISSGAGVAAQYAHCGIWNPSGSGKNVIIERLIISTAAASVVQYGTATNYIGSLNGGASSKKSGGTASTGQASFGNSATNLPSGFSYMGILQINANVPFDLVLKEPIIVQPNAGFAVANATTNTSLTITTEFFEESAT